MMVLVCGGLLKERREAVTAYAVML